MRNIIGHRIRQARLENNLTQEQLAIKLQIVGFRHTRNTIAKIESGFRQITDVEIKAMAELLHVSVGWLFEEKNANANSETLFP